MATPSQSDPQPPTRAELVQKSKKLARLFGQTPYADAVSNTTHRRHSIPVSPDDLSFLDFEDAVTHTPSAASIYESMSPEERSDEERRRMRLKMDRLNRFLGPRVPTDLALGIEPDSFVDVASSTPSSPVESRPNGWLRRRRSSSAAAFPPNWSEERMMDELSEEEKARHVKRALVLGKKFGLPPPPSLYTRHSPLSSISQPGHNASKSGSGSRLADFLPTLSHSNPTSNRSKGKTKDSYRPGSSDSNKKLISRYEHFNHSLLSLGDILDRDDRESLAELHHYLNDDEVDAPPLQEFVRSPDRSSFSSTTKSIRRRSLPSGTSVISVTSEYSLASPSAEVSQFEQRRRKAAKLTQFFGVDYVLLINHVLGSIEKGVQEDRMAGRLDTDQTEVLMQKVRALRARGESFSSS